MPGVLLKLIRFSWANDISAKFIVHKCINIDKSFSEKDINNYTTTKDNACILGFHIKSGEMKAVSVSLLGGSVVSDQ